MHSMFKVFRSFRSRMVLLFSLSMLFSGIITYLIYKVLQLFYHTFAEYGDGLSLFRQMINNIGDIKVFFLIFAPLSFLFFYLLTNRYSFYFQEISTGINHLAQGDFTYRVHINSNDEFQDIAKDINQANEHLKEAVERGDFSESSKNQLVINLAHDLRTPLTSVLGYIDLLLKDENLTQDQINHYLMIAYKKSQRLDRLIDELFEITRMNYGKLPVNKKKIDLSDLLYQLKEELFPVFEKNNLIIRTELPTHLPIMGDGELIARVFENLLTNANRYGYDGQYVDINGFLDNDDVVIQIINYGDSIPQDELPYLFDMFYKGDKARIHKEGSTGLGLFIAKNIVDQHDGIITVDSSLIRTIFEVRLPQNI